MKTGIPISQLKFKLGEFRWAFLIIGFLASSIFTAAYLTGFNSNFLLFISLLTINFYVATVDLRKSITLFLIISFIYGLLNRISYNFSPVDFNFLYAYPQFALFGISAIALIRHIQNHQFRFRLFFLDKLILIFLAWSMIQAMNPYQSLVISLYGIRFRVVTVFVYFLVRLYVRNKSELLFLYRLLIILAIITALYGIFQRLVGLPNYEFVWIQAFPEILAQKAFTQGGGQGGWYNDGVLRFFSTFSGGNEFNYVMAFLFIFLAGFNPLKIGSKWQLSRWTAIVSILVVIALTRERTPIAMIAVGISILILLRIYPSYSRIFLFLFLAIILITISLLISANRQQVINLLGDDLAAIRLLELASPFQADTVLWRIEEKWIPSLQKIVENPIGYGLGASRYSRVTREGQLLIAPHNTFLEIGLELGLLGFLFFSLIILEFIRWTHALKTQCRKIDYMRFLPDTLIAVIASALACAIVSTVLLDTAGLLVWLCIGLTPVLSRLVQKSSMERADEQHVEINPIR